MNRNRWRILIATLVIVLSISVVLTVRYGSGRDAFPPYHYRVTVQDVVKDHETLVVLIEIEARATSFVHVNSDEPDQGGVGAMMPKPPPPPRPWIFTRWPFSMFVGNPRPPTGQAQPATQMRLTLLGDRVNQSGADLFKFQANIGCDGCGWGGMYDKGPYPEGKPIEDVLAVGLRSGTYREGEQVRLMSRGGRTYHLLVDPPKE